MGGYSVMCDCRKWFVTYDSYKDHCRSSGHVFHPDRIGAVEVREQTPHAKAFDGRGPQQLRLFPAGERTEASSNERIRLGLERLVSRVRRIEASRPRRRR